jgi:hypothetical protein
MATAAQNPVTVRFSRETSESLLRYASGEGGATPETITRFVEETVRRRLFEINSQKVRAAFSDMTEDEIQTLVDEAVAWARSPEGRACE